MTLLRLLFIFCTCCTLLGAQINPDRIDIVRDQWGVPHIFAPTDPEVAYGFAWATAEDDFKTMQQQLLPVKGLMGQVYGKDGAVADILAHLVEAEEVVRQRYLQDVSPAFKAYLDAFAAGANAYAKSHPEEVLHRKLFPIKGEDIVKAFVMGVSLMSHTHQEIQRLFAGRVRSIQLPEATGSNAFAINSTKTTDGKTYLAINAHQPLEGLNSWYEAHLCSEEGMNILGGAFAGSPVITLGANENLGWAHTLNYADFTDVYQLEMHPEKKGYYRLDDQWLKLEDFSVKARVKIMGFLKLGKKQKFYKSKYGVTFATDQGYFALRFPANRDIKSAEQWYRMGKAGNWQEFKAALDMQGLPCMNLVYADRDDCIYYLSNGRYPLRQPGYDWKGVLPGNTSATLWPDEYYPLDSLPHVLNPSSGYVYNCNHTPFLSSDPANNPKLSAVPATTGHEAPDVLTNRADRFDEMISQLDKVSYDDFKRIKYDRSYNRPLHAAPKLEPIFHLDENKYPDLKTSILLLKNWDREALIESEAASLFILAFRHIKKRIRNTAYFRSGDRLSEDLLVESIRHARDYCQAYFGVTHVPLGRLQRHTRGEVNLPVSGGPDVLAALSASPQEDGTLRARAGDSYIELVRFSKEGVEIESIHAYGASSKPGSTHYTDQMDMYVNRKLKTMTLNRDEVYQNALRVYHPR